MQEQIQSLRGKCALVTGAGSGIGAATAQQLAAQGARVALLGRTRDTIARTHGLIVASGGESLPLTGDIGEEGDVRRCYEAIQTAWNQLDIVVANAGINGVWSSLDELTSSDWDQTMRINLRGTFLTTKYALPMLRQSRGNIVVVSSINGTRTFSNTGATAYACSKAAQVAFVKMTAIELARSGIRINVVCPGSTRTDIIKNTEIRNLASIRVPVHFPEGVVPLTPKRGASAEQVAAAILFLSSQAADHITGTELWIDGAESLLH